MLLCGSNVPGRYVAGVRKLHTGEWLTGWYGQEPGVDPNEVASANAHRRPVEATPERPDQDAQADEADASPITVTRHTLQELREAAADTCSNIASVGDDDATDIADLATAIEASTAVDGSGVDAGDTEVIPTTMVARLSFAHAPRWWCRKMSCCLTAG